MTDPNRRKIAGLALPWASAPHPIRLQLSRARGFDLQWQSRLVNGLPAAKVDRAGIAGGLLGNPFPVAAYGQSGAVEMHRRWLARRMSVVEMQAATRADRWRETVSLVVLRNRVLAELGRRRGVNFACWCAAAAPCHADTLIALANDPSLVEA